MTRSESASGGGVLGTGMSEIEGRAGSVMPRALVDWDAWGGDGSSSRIGMYVAPKAQELVGSI